MEYTFKQEHKSTIGEKARKKFHSFKRKLIRGLITVAGVVAGLMALFAGHVFTFLVVGGLTFFFYKNKQGLDEFIGTHETAKAF